ncbi:MAG: hypothetical protein AB1332_06695 [Pseudomonadota bacterium]|jgi:hypothetical protein
MDAATTAAMLQALRDPTGVPSHPLIFQVLMVFTWIPHILFVNLTLGSALMALYAFMRRNEPHWQRLSEAMTKVAKVGVSLLVVLGVAPLLFTQTIYDPQWYASNVLSAAWVIGFIFTLTVGYLAWFTFYFKNHGEHAPAWAGWLGAFGLVMFLLDGFIMHVLSYQGLLPDQWFNWYVPHGQVDMSGTVIHAWQAPRFGFYLAMSATLFGIFLMAYADYFRSRPDRPADYLTFARRIGARIAVVGAGGQLVLLLWWLLDVPSHLGMWAHPMSWALMAFIAVLAAAVWLARTGGPGAGYRLMAMGVGMAALVAIFREALRMTYLQPFAYSALEYKVLWDVPSFVMFLLTLVGVGGLMGGFIITAAYKSGRVQGMYEADATLRRLAVGSLTSTIVWVAAFIGTGIWIWLRNH